MKKMIETAMAFGSEKTEVFFWKDSYVRTDGLYVGIIEAETGEPFADLTVNLPTEVDAHPTIKKLIASGKCAFIDVNNLYCDIVTRLESLGLIENTGLVGFSGFGMYPLYRFSDEFISEWCASEAEEEKEAQAAFAITSFNLGIIIGERSKNEEI